VWNRTVPAPVDSSPAIRQDGHRSVAYIGCDDGFVYAMKVRPDGTDDGLQDPVNSTYDTIWAANLTSLVASDDVRVRSSPAVNDVRVYVGVGSNTLVALNITTGAVDWQRQLGSPAEGKYLLSSPALAENRLFVGADALYAINARNGATVWTYAPGGWFFSSPAVSVESPISLRGIVYATSENGRICAFSRTVPIPPLAVISQPSEGQKYRTGETIEFDGSASWDPDGEVVNYTWSFGDGNTSYNSTDRHVFAQSGEYNISLTVRDDRGLEGRAFIDIVVRNNAAPRLGFPMVSPDAGDVSTLFRLKVTYYDADNDPARDIAAAAGGTVVPLGEVDTADTNTADGKEYYCETTLPSGVYGVYFEASDGVLFNRTPDATAMTVTNRRVFSNEPKNDTFVELFYAGLGGVHFDTSSVGHEPPRPLVQISQAGLPFTFLLSEYSIDSWWWANISVNYSALGLAGVNISTIRIYWWNTTSNAWIAAENTGTDLARNITYANVTQLGNFTVVGQPPVNHAPVARLSRHDLAIMEGETATFNASGSYDQDGNDTLTYFWDFGDTSKRTPVPGYKTAEHKYAKAGRYTVTLTVSDGKLNSTDTLVVTVKQKGGEQYVLILVVVIVLVVGILFFLPRGDKRPEDRWKEEDEKFRKGMEARKPSGKKTRKGGGAAAGEEE
jgi:PKD repeat protein